MATADLVLSRFPRHLDADTPDKIIGDVVGALATAAETQIVQVGQVRRARRIGERSRWGKPDPEDIRPIEDHPDLGRTGPDGVRVAGLRE